jgi:hypothetical protein
MKKLFTFAMALMAAMAINATDYYFAGAANGWSNNNDAWKFVDVEGVLTLEVADLYGEFKVTEDRNWHPQHGAAAQGEGVALGGSYNLVKCDDSEGEKDAPANCAILIPNEGDWRYKNAKLTLDASNPDALVISLVAGTLYDHSAAPKTYQIVGAFNSWDAAGAPSFEDVEGVLTVTVDNLSGTFKIIEDHAWTNQWATNWETGAGLELGVPYTLGAKGEKEPDNLSLANPFGGYKNAVLTLDISGEDFILTLVSGEFELVENDWFVPGAWNGWKCDEAAKMDPVDGAENTYELLLAEFSGEFKVVYGEWAVEFGAEKNSGETWTVNDLLVLSFPCDNMKPEDATVTYEDVTITLVVDYENVEASLLIETESETGVQTVPLNIKSIKRIENGQVLIENNGVRYNMNGIAQ